MRSSQTSAAETCNLIPIRWPPGRDAYGDANMADAHAKHHDYHLVNPSPWPAVGATFAFITAVGLIIWNLISDPDTSEELAAKEGDIQQKVSKLQ